MRALFVDKRSAAGGLLLMQQLAFWPFWRWYRLRLLDGSDEPWGVLALLTVLILIVLKGRKQKHEIKALWLALIPMLIYAGAFPLLSPLGRGVLVMLATSLSVSGLCFGRILHFGVLGLLLLALPLISSLQFFCGYPLRFLTAALAAQLIQLTGFDVSATGTILSWLGEFIVVDAPCSGIRMLWSGLYFNFLLASFLDIGAARTWLSYSAASIAIFSANVLRTTALFYTESGIVTAPGWVHGAIGLAAFSFAALVIINMNLRMHRCLSRA
jgi:exosortase/archaeosortase family protein